MTEGGAFNHGLAENPDDSLGRVESTSVYTVKWAQKDPAAASEWLRSLPASDAKQSAQKSLAAYWLQ